MRSPSLLPVPTNQPYNFLYKYARFDDTAKEFPYNFELKVQLGRGSKNRLFILWREALTDRTSHIGTRHNKRRGTSMVSHWDVEPTCVLSPDSLAYHAYALPVGLKSIVLATEHDTDVGGMLSRAVEIGIITAQTLQFNLFTQKRI